ncbi:hypothetical protein [Afipia sp. 1NLS2]|uniref:hypothetical protein n=1 Tax=Afipia sp. 1NLS2 TaxID=666684 RepID=UPI0001D9EC9C|nr:hypothetical protein [Afipia sp. 1NLS2]EFI50086.1 hypothetical protein AfiDRAFT_3793 [Afipia sp. 1NLS2]
MQTITEEQRQIVVLALARMFQVIDAHRDEIKIDPADLGTTIDFQVGYQPDLDNFLKRWKSDPVGQGLRQGIRELGRMIAPHVTIDTLKKIATEAASQSQNLEWSMAVADHMWDGLKTSDGTTWTA